MESTRIIAVCSGKGGVGKTNFAVNLGIAYTAIQKRALIFDADLGLSNVNILLNAFPQYSLFHSVKNGTPISDVVHITEYGVGIISGGSGMLELVDIPEARRESLIQDFASLQGVDTLIIDTPAGAGEGVVSFLRAAHDIIVVTTPDPTAVADAYALIKIAVAKIGGRPININIVVNKVRSPEEATFVAGKLVSVAKTFLGLAVKYLGFVYEDARVASSVREKVPFMARHPKTKAAACINRILQRLEGADYERGLGLKKMFEFLNK